MHGTKRPPKLFAGERLRRLREQHQLSQIAMASLVGLSPSYFNQIENDQRPLPNPVLHRLCTHFDVDFSYFEDGDASQLTGTLRQALADPVFGDAPVDMTELQTMVRDAPDMVSRFMRLYRRHREREELLDARQVPNPVVPSKPASQSPHEEVRDWVQSHSNHFGTLEQAAERLTEREDLHSAGLRDGLPRYLKDAYAITVVEKPSLLERGLAWRFEPAGRAFQVAQGASTESRVFWMAHYLALVEQHQAIDRFLEEAKFSTREAGMLARVSLANYFAGALMMPYDRFLAAARSVRYDIQRLQLQFGASFEQVCHRLSTMQRPGRPGIPFHFVKIDMAGNVLKHSSATRFQFTHFGGPCPLWNIYRSFTQAGQISIQIARTPDDVVYLNIARTVGRSGDSYPSRPRTAAVALGCEIQYAPQLVYAAGLDLQRLDIADPVGPGCRACSRTDCRHRALPPVGQALDISMFERGLLPYRIRDTASGV